VTSPAQCRERIKAAEMDLHVQQLIPEDRGAQTLSDLYNARESVRLSVVTGRKRKGAGARPNLRGHRPASGRRGGSLPGRGRLSDRMLVETALAMKPLDFLRRSIGTHFPDALRKKRFSGVSACVDRYTTT